jgi:hypothetical protein
MHPDRSFGASRPERSMDDQRGSRPAGSVSSRARAAGSDRPRPREDDMAYRSRAGEHFPADAPRRSAPPRGSDRGRPLAPDAPVPSRSAAEASDGRSLRGFYAVVAVFLVTLAGGAIDSFLGVGLSTITLIALVGGTILATWLVRRRDLASMVIAPPLIFTVVAGVNIALAPSATFSLTTIATLLVRGFPTMAIATGAAVVLCLIRWASRR